MITYKYKTLLTVIELKSFSKAAEKLGYTQSGITHILNSLESEFNLKLLVRDRSGVYPTVAGNELLPYIKKVCESDDVLMQKIGQIKNEESNIVRIGTFQSVATHILPELIINFHNLYPDIIIETIPGTYDEIEFWLKHNLVDIGFTVLPTGLALQSWPFLKDEIMVILPQNHPLCDFEEISCDKLLEFPFIANADKFKRDCDKVPYIDNLRNTSKFRFRDESSIMAMVEKGLGITLKPKLLIERTPFDVNIKRLSPPVYREIAIAANDEHQLSSASRLFLNMAISTVK